MGYLFAFFAALANAVASVLQRHTGRHESHDREMRLALVADLIRNPVWLCAVVAMTAGFLLQILALSRGRLAAVQPVLAMELPITIALAGRVFGGHVDRRQWSGILGMTAGLAGLILALGPTGGSPREVSTATWIAAAVASYGVLIVLVAWGRRIEHDTARAAVYGIATGAGFGTTAAFMSGMTDALHNGILTVFTTWQTYLMLVTGIFSMFLLQNAVAAGNLVAAQPGFTLADPVVAILWGTIVFGEATRGGGYIAVAVASFLVIAASVLVLSSSPWLHDRARAEPGSGADRQMRAGSP